MGVIRERPSVDGYLYGEPVPIEVLNAVKIHAPEDSRIDRVTVSESDDGLLSFEVEMISSNASYYELTILLKNKNKLPEHLEEFGFEGFSK